MGGFTKAQTAGWHRCHVAGAAISSASKRLDKRTARGTPGARQWGLYIGVLAHVQCMRLRCIHGMCVSAW